MDIESETTPLVNTLEHEAWRGSRKARILRLPSNMTITGVIIAMLFVMVTSLILFKNLEPLEENDLEINKTILASPIEYRKETSDSLRKEERVFVKANKAKKWNKMNKSWNYVRDPSGFYSIREDSQKNWRDEDVINYRSDLRAYAKELEESWGIPHHLGEKELEHQESINDDIKKRIVELLQSLKTSDSRQEQDQKGRKESSDQGDGKTYDQSISDDRKNKMDTLRSSQMSNNKWRKVHESLKNLNSKAVLAPIRCPLSKAHREHLHGSSTSANEINCASIAEEARKELGECIDLSFLPKECKPPSEVKCSTIYRYRKIDGTCNNKMHPTWGKSGTPYDRMIAPEYSDGIAAVRTSQNGEPLPNARILSKKLYSKRMKTKTNEDTSVLFLYFGLLIDHDMAATASNSESINCCDQPFLVHPENRPKECIPIDVPDGDPFYGPRYVKCLNLMRSFPVIGECPGRREQMNKATSYLDGSAIYGSTIEQSSILRTLSRGQFKTQRINNTPFMTISEEEGFTCGTPDAPLQCFKAGDARVNMMVELTAMHTIWYREHNRIATELYELNPHWTDEKLFQEARRILIGELQHIAYSEFLPLLLGEKTVQKFDLKINESMVYGGYDDTIDASVFNVFAAAAFRFGHSLAPDMQYLLGPNNSTISTVPLHETFFNGNLLYHNGLDLLLRGAASQQTQSVDSYITPEVREHLFQPTSVDYGHDLAAVGIQRGRDHGLPPYVKWRSACGLSEVKAWEDLFDIMDEERAEMFQEVYSSVDDIDLIPGALAENHAEGSLLGPTYTCLLGRQFQKTRKGDRYWFEEQNNVGSFTRGQLNQMYKSNMARIVCDNSDAITAIQKHVFKVPSLNNPVVDCNTIPKVDLSEWKA